jgi:hypothetical protein
MSSLDTKFYRCILDFELLVAAFKINKSHRHDLDIGRPLLAGYQTIRTEKRRKEESISIYL